MEDNKKNTAVTPADTPAETTPEVTETAAKAAETPAADTKEKSRFARFLNRKNIVISGKRYGIDALGAMAQGLFASLLIGTIIATLGEQFLKIVPEDWPVLPDLCTFFVTIGTYAKQAAGPAMAVSIAYALQAPPLVLFSSLAVGVAANTEGGAGGPLAVLLITIIAVEFGKAVSKETKVDILVTPFVTIFIGGILSILCAPWIGKGASEVGTFINWATNQAPFIMGVLISVVIGMALTLPISSAAICAAIGITGLAGGAAVAGCCAQMIGFAFMSYRENKVGGLVSQGLGTSMLQMGNIVKNPLIWIPPTLASAITGPIATCLFKMHMDGASICGGMGTCGLVGQIGVVTGWTNTGYVPGAMDWIGLVMICLILPAILSVLFCEILRKMGWIKEGDLKLPEG
ncbi:MAG: PTS sugar transporter subunit IIC [Lachnospiraceae bacterium]|nr:PTS sugar transporter subunit IIC [Lachnospiraceae bacterium]